MAFIGISCKKSIPSNETVNAKFVFQSNTSDRMVINYGAGSDGHHDTINGNTTITYTATAFKSIREHGVVSFACNSRLLSSNSNTSTDTNRTHYCQTFIYINNTLSGTGNLSSINYWESDAIANYNW